MYSKNNIFFSIINDKIPCHKVYENEYALVFHDIAPLSPVHLLAIPKKGYKSFDDFTLSSSHEEMISFYKAIQKVTEQLGLVKKGYRLITNHGKDGLQTVEHFHVHILGGKYLGPLLNTYCSHHP